MPARTSPPAVPSGDPVSGPLMASGDNAAPARQPTLANTRRETILSLVEMLLRNDDIPPSGLNNQQPNFEDDRDVPTVDEHHQVVGAEAFNKFQRRITNLDKELRNFANAARQLGSSVAILSSAFHLRERLAQILFLFRENAADLFPRKVSRRHREAPINPRAVTKTRRRHTTKRYKPPPNVAQPIIRDDLDVEAFPEQFQSLAQEVTTFLDCLNEFPEFTDEAVNASILSFEGDLKYWASCLKAYQGQFKYPAVQRYIHDLSAELGEHMDSITATLSMFIEIGVPTIRFAQKHGATNLLNLSTVATFFSAVTATTLQFSYTLPPDDDVAISVNCFWFLSMVFSIAAAVNSLLGLTWKQAMYRSPGHRVPWWVLIWIKRSPLVFLVMSVACFSIGLCAFAYASGQAHITSTITTVFTAFTSFGLCAVSAWFASERWIFLRHKGKKWLGDVLVEAKDHFMQLPGIQPLRKGMVLPYRAIRHKISRLGDGFKFVGSWIVSHALTHGADHHGAEANGDDIESAAPDTPSILPMYNNHLSVEQRGPPGHTRKSSDAGHTTVNTVQGHSASASERDDATSPGAGGDTPVSPTSPATPGSPTTPSKGKLLWKNALRTVKMSSAIAPAPAKAGTPRRQRTTSSTMGPAVPERKMTLSPLSASMNDPLPLLMRSRVSELVPKLRHLEPVQELAPHQALVRHLQFSPDGRFLATSSWDRTSVIFRVADPNNNPRTLIHPQGFVGQVAWSPNGNFLLTKMRDGIKVWTEDGVCKRTIFRFTPIEAITWCPDGETFMSVEGSDVVKLDLKGTILDKCHFGRMKLHDVGVTHDSQRLIGVGPLLESPSGLHPSKSKVEKRLVVYNMETKQIENQTPVYNEVRDITISRKWKNGVTALISYENKAPPQLWKLKLIKDRDNNLVQTGRLELRHTYMPKVLVDFAGPSYFGGKDDELVLCAGKAGDIHIWDQESGALLHHVRAQVLGGDLTCIAWNHAAEAPFMFATGSHDGAVRVWSQPRHHDGDDIDDNDDDRLPAGPALLRTSSPFELDMDRTDSPITQQDYDESIPALDESVTNLMAAVAAPPPSDAGDSSIRDRSVTFAPSRSGSLG
ncbi:hypothetical protein HGRIS_011496 [Hohenbuehelia grisea]|uniref:WD40 repeat-like protein n=1 Tax=Hohenbuehelia grisea TaxID=104357 RepID=A0ABR3JW33_9AGAR